MPMCMSCSISSIPKPGCGSMTISSSAAPRPGRWNMNGKMGGFIASSGCRMPKSARMRRRGPPGWHFRKIRENSKIRKSPSAERAVILPTNAENPGIKIPPNGKFSRKFSALNGQEFFAEGKSEFSRITEFDLSRDSRGISRALGRLLCRQKDGADSEMLAEMKAELVAEQKTTLEARRDEACKELTGIAQRAVSRAARRSARRPSRAALAAGGWARQCAFPPAGRREEHGKGYCRSARLSAKRPNEVVARQEEDAWHAEDYAFTGSPRDNRSGMKSGADISANVAGGIGIGPARLHRRHCGRNGWSNARTQAAANRTRSAAPQYVRHCLRGGAPTATAGTRGSRSRMVAKATILWGISAGPGQPRPSPLIIRQTQPSNSLTGPFTFSRDSCCVRRRRSK